MSKNFELMQNLGKEHEMFQTGAATATATATELIRESLRAARLGARIQFPSKRGSPPR